MPCHGCLHSCAWNTLVASCTGQLKVSTGQAFPERGSSRSLQQSRSRATSQQRCAPDQLQPAQLLPQHPRRASGTSEAAACPAAGAGQHSVGPCSMAWAVSTQPTLPQSQGACEQGLAGLWLETGPERGPALSIMRAFNAANTCLWM